MRVMALDVGDRRIGVAISDPTGMLASPLTTLERGGSADMAAADAVIGLAREHSAGEIVVGIPYLMSGRTGEQARVTLEFAEALAALADVPVRRVDERLSSALAERMLAQAGETGARRGGRGLGNGSRGDRGRIDAAAKGRVDAAAAAVILQGYLDGRG